ncbi:MAG: type II secretion system F family protein, partial [Microlunatus sp.]|nr:type II secretion system F family protein [Microlunatus sp.]
FGPVGGRVMRVFGLGFLVLAVVTWPGRTWPGTRTRAGHGRRRGIRRRPGRGHRRADLDTLTSMVEGIAPAVAAGVAPATAVATSALLASGTVSDRSLADDLQHFAREAAAGAELAPLWSDLHTRHQVAALGEVARAWALSEQIGCAVGDALRAASAMMREQRDLERRVAAATAGPRATMQLLTLLPVLGVGIAMLIGVPPWRLYAGSLGLSVLVAGVAFVVAGRLLTRRMIGRAVAAQALS